MSRKRSLLRRWRLSVLEQKDALQVALPGGLIKEAKRKEDVHSLRYTIGRVLEVTWVGGIRYVCCRKGKIQATWDRPGIGLDLGMEP